MSGAAAGVSIVVPVRDGGDVLGECLAALARQTHPRAQLEIIVVDNGSRDASAEIAARHAARCVREDRVRTSYAARNAGVRAARHELIAFTDADCVASPQWIAAAVAAFEPGVGCVGGPIESLPPATWVQRYQARRRLLSSDEALAHARRPYAQTANAVYRRAVFDAVGLFEDEWCSGGDADLGWRMLLHGFTLRHAPQAVVQHRHRATVIAMLQQRFRHGRGRALLERKWEQDLARPSNSQEREGFWRRPHRRDLLPRDIPLELLSVAAFHLGRITARPLASTPSQGR